MAAWFSLVMPALVACGTVGFMWTRYRMRKAGHMSNPTHVTGRITITPPITHAELRDVPHLTRCKVDKNNVSTWRQAWLDITENAEETTEGTWLRREANGIRAFEEDQTPWHLEDHIQQIVDEFPDRSYGGWFECRDDHGVYRLIVRDGKVTEVRPTMVWPE